jgi:probable rRNA maturation factor
MKGFAGDVAISAEIAAQNARRLGHTVADEIRILTLHAMLHLAGYDHERDNGEMERKEARLRKSLGLPVGLLERSGRRSLGKDLNSKIKNKGKPSGASGPTRVPVPKRNEADSGSRATRKPR